MPQKHLPGPPATKHIAGPPATKSVGVRIQHPTARNVTFTLVDASRPYRRSWTCPPPPAGCARTHEFKTYHLRLDETGAVIVSTEIVERLRRIPNQPFAIANQVEHPPDQVVRLPLIRRPLIAVSPGARHDEIR